MRLGIVGCGAVVEHFYCLSLPGLPHVTVAGVSDRSVARQTAIAQRLRCPALPLEELLGRIDLLIVATPPSSHASIAEAALSAGVNVWVEKPFASSAADARRVVDLAHARSRNVFVAQFRRYFSGVRLAREIMASGLFGAVRRIEMFEGGRFRWAAQSDYFTADPTGGVLLDTGAHTLDMALYISGLDRATVECHVSAVSRDKPEPAHEIEASFELQSPAASIPCCLKLSRFSVLANRVRIHGETGWLECGTNALSPVRFGREAAAATVVHPPGGFLTPEQAFHDQARAIVLGAAREVLAGRLFLNQMTILDRILHHGD